MASQRHRVIVVGGGVAGIAAAVDLAQAGADVTLLEQRPRLGGRASSMDDPKTGRLIDNCQHVLTRACTALMDLYDRLGVSESIAWTDKLWFADPDTPTHWHTIQGDDLPAPMHLVRPMLRFGLLTPRERFDVSRAMLNVLQAGSTRSARAAMNDRSFADWLNEQGQSVALIEKFWSPIVVSACNETCDRVALGYAMQVFQEGMLATHDAYHVGLATCPLAELYGPAETLIQQHGGQVRCGVTVSAVRFANGRAAGMTLNTNEELNADAVVLALPSERLGDLLPAGIADTDERFARLDELEHSPIVGIHLYVRHNRDPAEHRVLPHPHVVLPGRPIHWFFDQGVIELGEAEAGTLVDGPGPCRHIHAVISAARDAVAMTNDELAQLAFDELRRVVGPTGAALSRVHQRVIKERHATFSVTPGVDALRPDTTGNTPGLLLAGDWTDTGWPATMEGAARSGFDASAAALGQPIPDEPRLGSRLYRLVAG
ncbi:MAG: hydroxysqualene dehydroxylase HpnE [Planctomycetota bacterium]